jgi:MFS family permease
MFLQSVMGASATAAGLSLMVLMVSLNLSAGAAGQFFGRMRRYKMIPLAGLAVTISAVLTLAWRTDVVGPREFELLLALIGLGFGPLAPFSTVVVQNSVPIWQFGTATGTMTFIRNLLATMLVAVFGAIVLGGVAPEQVHGNGIAPLAGNAAGFTRVFLAAAACLTVAFVLLLLLKEKPLRTEIATEGS